MNDIANKCPPIVRLMTDDELRNHQLINNVKEFCRKIALPRRRIRDFCLEGMRDSPALLVGSGGDAVEANLEAVLDDDGFEFWYRDWIKHPVPAHVAAVHPASIDRVIFLITALKMIFLRESRAWGDPMGSWCSAADGKTAELATPP